MSRERLAVALITDVFYGEGGGERLLSRLLEARTSGAEVAVLPELPLNPWSPTSREASDADAEPPSEGPRQRVVAEAARSAGIAVVAGAIVRDAVGRRHNTALVYDAEGRAVASYRKVHLPSEEGFWESDHYQPGDDLPEVLDVGHFPVGIQICSDVNRPAASNILGARGAMAVLVPRATPPETYPRWRVVLRANAVTSGLYVISVNRPVEPGAPIGGPSLAIGPDGEMLVETTDPIAVVVLERAAVVAARKAYPGYLAVRSELYALGWLGAAAEACEKPRPD